MTYDGWFTGSKRMDPNTLVLRPRPSPHATLWGAASSGEGFHDEDGVFDGRDNGDAGRLVTSSVSGAAAAAAAVAEGKHSFTLDHQHTLDLKYTCPKVFLLFRWL